MATDEKTRDIMLRIPESVAKRMEIVAHATGADSMTEVIRRALSVYDELVTRTVIEGGALTIQCADGSAYRMDLL